jgi:hypothetical protein
MLSTSLTTSFRLFGVYTVFVTCMRVRSSEVVGSIHHTLTIHILSAPGKFGLKAYIPLDSKLWIRGRRNQNIAKCQTMLLDLPASHEVDCTHIDRLDDQTRHKSECCAHTNIQTTFRVSRIMQCTDHVCAHSALAFYVYIS